MKFNSIGGLAVSVLFVAAPLRTASAADMPLKAPPPAVVASVYNWTGFYIGGNVGYGVASDPSAYALATVPPLFSFQSLDNELFKMAPAGALAGIQAGYNWQASNWVFGLEADFQATGQRDSVCVNICENPGPTFASTVNQKLPWFGTVRGRVGIAADRTLFYATGGLAYGRIDTNITETNSFLLPIFGPQTVTAGTSTDKTGWALGGGIEAALGANWSAKVEYLHVDLGSQTVAFADSDPARADTFTTAIRENIIRAGLNYRFGAAPTGISTTMPVKAPVAVASVYNWTGFYVGVNAGYGVGNNPNTYTTASPPFLPADVFNAESYKISPAGILGGGQLGYNVQVANWVAGVEADIQATGQSDSACVNGCSTNIALHGSTATVEQKLPWFGTVRGRLGVTAGQTLFYGTGGLAYGNTETNVAQNVGTPLSVTTSVSQTKTGWTLGGGIETVLAANWSAKVEYLYVDLGSQNIAFFDPFGARTTITTSFRDNVFRAGLNYKFDWGGPVIARY